MIDKFKGKYAFLSNFFPCKVLYGLILDENTELADIIYASAEHAYQAQKALNRYDRLRIKNCDTAGQAKRLGQKIEIRKDWDNVRDRVMLDVIRDKFHRNPLLGKKLIATGVEQLVEGNTWRDTYWGVCMGHGENKLGEILMKVRRELKSEKTKAKNGNLQKNKTRKNSKNEESHLENKTKTKINPKGRSVQSP